VYLTIPNRRYLSNYLRAIIIIILIITTDDHASGTCCFSSDYTFITIGANCKSARLLNNIWWCHGNIELDKIQHSHMGAISVDKRNGNWASCKTNVSISIPILYYIFTCRYPVFDIYGIGNRLLYIPWDSISVHLSVNKINNSSQYFKLSASVCTYTFIGTSKRDEKLKLIKMHRFISINE